MKTTFLKYASIGLLFFVSISCSKDEDQINQEVPNDVSVTDQILTLVNEHRQNQGLQILKKSDTADQLAEEHSRYMITQGTISHDNQQQKFKVLREQESAQGFAENVASGQPTAQAVMQAWLQSTGHKENIEGNYTHIGIGAVKDQNGKYYYTQIFYR